MINYETCRQTEKHLTANISQQATTGPLQSVTYLLFDVYHGISYFNRILLIQIFPVSASGTKSNDFLE